MKQTKYAILCTLLITSELSLELVSGIFMIVGIEINLEEEQKSSSKEEIKEIQWNVHFYPKSGKNGLRSAHLNKSALHYVGDFLPDVSIDIITPPPRRIGYFAVASDHHTIVLSLFSELTYNIKAYELRI